MSFAGRLLLADPWAYSQKEKSGTALSDAP